MNDLAKDPERFIEFVENKIQQHGMAKKLVPPAAVVKSEARDIADAELGERVQAAVENMIDLDGIKSTVIDKQSKKIGFSKVPKLLKDWAKKMEPISWRAHVEHLMTAKVDEIDDELTEAVEAEMQKVAQSLTDE